MSKRKQLDRCGMDREMNEVISKIPRLEQRQHDLKTQMRYLYNAASRLGLYDAGDLISKMGNVVEFIRKD